MIFIQPYYLVSFKPEPFKPNKPTKYKFIKNFRSMNNISHKNSSSLIENCVCLYRLWCGKYTHLRKGCASVLYFILISISIKVGDVFSSP